MKSTLAIANALLICSRVLLWLRFMNTTCVQE